MIVNALRGECVRLCGLRSTDSPAICAVLLIWPALKALDAMRPIALPSSTHAVSLLNASLKASGE